MKMTFLNNLVKYPLSFLLVIAFAGCDPDKFYDESLSLPGDRWPKEDALSFTVNIEDTVSPYSFYLNVRNSTSYKYNNIYFFLTTSYPGGGMSRDTIECMLASKNGEWLGKGNGRYRDNRIWVRDNIRFPRKGEYTLRLNQAMREDVLEGISEAGVRLEKK
ncbi:gliding motility lipoprotein GldH [Lentimicrobium saccharophilum]|nr:gliding motility lipoprotein GldH [Lentimicrobium saccharophilum]